MIFLLLEGVTDGVIGGYFAIFYGTLELIKRVQKTPRSLCSRGFWGGDPSGTRTPDTLIKSQGFFKRKAFK